MPTFHCDFVVLWGQGHSFWDLAQQIFVCLIIRCQFFRCIPHFPADWLRR
jgi:hypothetical protein